MLTAASLIYRRGKAATPALKDIQEAFCGEAERLGLRDEQDVVKMVKEVRKEMWEERHGSDA
jgi:hypothetical protein